MGGPGEGGGGSPIPAPDAHSSDHELRGGSGSSGRDRAWWNWRSIFAFIQERGSVLCFGTEGRRRLDRG